jgi:hypothetical protein
MIFASGTASKARPARRGQQDAASKTRPAKSCQYDAAQYDAAKYDRSERRRRIEFSASSDKASFLFRVSS